MLKEVFLIVKEESQASSLKSFKRFLHLKTVDLDTPKASVAVFTPYFKEKLTISST